MIIVRLNVNDFAGDFAIINLKVLIVAVIYAARASSSL